MLRIIPLLIVLLFGRVRVFADVQSHLASDRCVVYKSCASCIGAHYNSNEQAVMEERGRLLRHSTTKKDVLRWPHFRPTCVWCPIDETCSSKSDQLLCAVENNTIVSQTIQYEYNCPLGPIPYPDDPPSLLPFWMSALNDTGALEDVVLTDLSLPGTHDSLSYDLSLIVSEGDSGEMKELEKWLHIFSGGTIKLLPGELEEFFRLQAKTQQLTLTQQLDNGIRFIDFRIMMESDSKEWYSIHFMQSNNPVPYYFRQLREWMDAHPGEIVVLWLSKHGDAEATGQDQYPNVTPEQKQELWAVYTSIFDGLLIDSRESCIYTTPIGTLLQRSHRLITFTSDHEEFTGLSPLALDGAKLQNFFHENGVFDESETMKETMNYFENGAANNADLKRQSKFSLMSMNTPGTWWQVKHSAKHHFFHWWDANDLDPVLEGLFESCYSHIQIPEMNWCPETLLDISQLASFYNQIAIESANTMIEQGKSEVQFPNAFYLDALDFDGTLRTGTQVLYGAERSPFTASHKTSRYAYVDTILGYNVRRACQKKQEGLIRDSTQLRSWTCDSLMAAVKERKARHPLQVWEEPNFGRHADWPISLEKK